MLFKNKRSSKRCVFKQKVEELKQNPHYTSAIEFGDGLLKLLKNNIDEPIDDELLTYIYKGISKEVVYTEGGKTKKIKVLKALEDVMQELSMTGRSWSSKLDIWHIFNNSDTVLDSDSITYKNITFYSFDDIESLEFFSGEARVYSREHILICSSGFISLFGSKISVPRMTDFIKSFNNETVRLENPTITFPRKKVSLNCLYELGAKKTEVQKLLLRNAVDVSETSEEIIKDLCINKDFPFYLLCGKKTKRQLSEKTLDAIINSESFLSSDKLSASMGYDGRTIGYTNRYQTLLYQENISSDSFIKLISHPDPGLDDLKKSIKKRIPSFEKKFEGDSEVQLLIELMKMNIM